MSTRRRVPTGTYRLQLRKEFGFPEAAAVVPYLADLGVSHVYCSPILQAAPGSAHGYDVVDHSRISADLGGEVGWHRLVDTCVAAGLGLIVDVVPNHMAIPTPERLNAQLWDVLENGPRSAYATWFDIDWEAGDGKLLMPILGRPLADCLRDGEITIDVDSGVVRYYDHELPLAPGTDKLEAQHYRLAYWRVANEELNYRRFFDVTTLAGLRVEDDEVFDATHEVLLGLVRSGDVDGLRIDHPEGLADPQGYLARLRAASGGVWTVVEKILEGPERLPATWACDGTTGYDALAAVMAVLTDPTGGAALSDVYSRFTGRDDSFESAAEAAKRFVVDGLFAAEVDRLLRDLEPVRRDDLGAADFTTRGLRAAVVELLVQFDVYRAYAGLPDSRAHIGAATARAAHRAPERRAELEWVARVLTGEAGGAAAEAFVTRFGQATGPAMAKGVEDTTFYRYLRLVALNEVGADPGEFGRDVAEWHEFCTRTAADWPATMTTLSTHDTKRSEDVRARLLVLAEIPDEWERAVTRWRDRVGSVDANTDYLLWQTVVGACDLSGTPLPEGRLLAYLEKATREAKERTSWLDPDEGFESALAAHVQRIYADQQLLGDVTAWVREHLVRPGRSNTLAQKLLQLTMPGVPDVYQGQELPDFSLVDPDNRRPVDYDLRRHALRDLESADPKLRVTAAAFRLRRERPATFAGGYSPLAVSGGRAPHAVAFARGDDAVTVVTRLPVGLARAGGWGDTVVELPGGDWRNVFDNGTWSGAVALADLLAALPVALLSRGDGGTT